MPSYRAKAYVPDTLELQFFNNAGQVTFPQFGTSIFFDNEEVPELSPGPSWVPDTIETAAGVAFSSGKAVAQKWRFPVLQFNTLTELKVYRLEQAVESGWKIWARARGLYNTNPVTGVRSEVQFILNRAVLKYGEEPARRIKGGNGTVWKERKEFELWESKDMVVPQSDPVIVRGDGVSVVVVDMGGGTDVIYTPITVPTPTTR